MTALRRKMILRKVRWEKALARSANGMSHAVRRSVAHQPFQMSEKKATIKGGLEGHRKQQIRYTVTSGELVRLYFSHDLLTIWRSVMVM